MTLQDKITAAAEYILGKISLRPAIALVLGSGGTSNTATKALEDLGANVVIISRTGDNNYDNLHLHRDAV